MVNQAINKMTVGSMQQALAGQQEAGPADVAMAAETSAAVAILNRVIERLQAQLGDLVGQNARLVAALDFEQTARQALARERAVARSRQVDE